MKCPLRPSHFSFELGAHLLANKYLWCLSFSYIPSVNIFLFWAKIVHSIKSIWTHRKKEDRERVRRGRENECKKDTYFIRFFFSIKSDSDERYFIPSKIQFSTVTNRVFGWRDFFNSTPVSSFGLVDKVTNNRNMNMNTHTDKWWWFICFRVHNIESVKLFCSIDFFVSCRCCFIFVVGDDECDKIL